MSLRHFLKKNLLTIFSVLFLILFSFVLNAYATPPDSPFNPGETLNPACAPTDTNCKVNIGSVLSFNTPLSVSSNTVSVDLSNLVNTTTSQNIDGVKTFSVPPIVPSPSNDNEAANKSYVDQKVNGIATGFIWQPAVLDHTTIESPQNNWAVLQTSDNTDWVYNGSGWIEFNANTQPYSAGAGLFLSGTQFSIANSALTNDMLAGNISNDKLQTIGTTIGGTGLTSLGNPGQVMKVNAGGDALEWADGSVGTGGTSDWASLTNFPSDCNSGDFVTGVGATLTCATPTGGDALTFSNSLVNSSGTVSLVNDATPTASQYYGTDGTSTLGYHDLPSGTGGGISYGGAVTSGHSNEILYMDGSGNLNSDSLFTRDNSLHIFKIQTDTNSSLASTLQMYNDSIYLNQVGGYQGSKVGQLVLNTSLQNGAQLSYNDNGNIFGFRVNIDNSNQSFSSLKSGIAVGEQGTSELELINNSYSWFWPQSDSTGTQALTSDGSGNLGWTSIGGSSGWSLTGNAGTDPATNFIGTTDDEPIILKINNNFAGIIESSINHPGGPPDYDVGNTFLGYQAGGGYVGSISGGLNTNTFNTAIGTRTLSSNIGNGNTAIGSGALLDNSSGSNNVAIGVNAGMHETGNNNFYVDSLGRNDEADGRLKSLIYGKFDASTANQFVNINGTLGILDSTGAYYTKITGGSQSGDISYTLPTAQGGASTVLTNDGSGVLSWASAGNNWSLTGNAGTDPATNFIGTTDAQPLIFKVNNVQAGKIENGNAFYGYSSAGSNLSGTQNVAIGQGTFSQNTIGNYNTAIGTQALTNNISGSGNVAIGQNAGYYETTSNNLYIDNDARLNESDGRIKSLIYGKFDAYPANQFVTINGKLNVNGRVNISSLPTSPDGLSAGDLWDDNGIVSIVELPN